MAQRREAYARRVKDTEVAALIDRVGTRIALFLRKPTGLNRPPPDPWGEGWPDDRPFQEIVSEKWAAQWERASGSERAVAAGGMAPPRLTLPAREIRAPAYGAAWLNNETQLHMAPDVRKLVTQRALEQNIMAAKPQGDASDDGEGHKAKGLAEEVQNISMDARKAVSSALFQMRTGCIGLRAFTA